MPEITGLATKIIFNLRRGRCPSSTGDVDAAIASLDSYNLLCEVILQVVYNYSLFPRIVNIINFKMIRMIDSIHNYRV